MNERLKRNLKTWIIYSLGFIVVLLPFLTNILFLKIVSIAIILGFFAQLLNDIFQQVRIDQCGCYHPENEEEEQG